jgi:hypothetical protein
VFCKKVYGSIEQLQQDVDDWETATTARGLIQDAIAIKTPIKTFLDSKQNEDKMNEKAKNKVEYGD